VLTIIGYEDHEFIGKKIRNFFVSGQKFDSLFKTLCNGEFIENHEIELFHKNGTIKTMLINSNVFRKEGKFCHTRCFLRDITELKASYHAIRNQIIEDAEKNIQIQKEFVDTICHEIRNPLHGILGSLYLLQERIGRMQSQICEDFENMEEALQELKNLTDSIYECGRHQKVILDHVLDLSKLERNNVDLCFTTFDPRDTVLSVYKMLRGDIKNDVQLATVFDGNDWEVFPMPSNLLTLVQ
jgi:PAS domain S-box-containing protein